MGKCWHANSIANSFWLNFTWIVIIVEPLHFKGLGKISGLIREKLDTTYLMQTLWARFLFDGDWGTMF